MEREVIFVDFDINARVVVKVFFVSRLVISFFVDDRK